MKRLTTLLAILSLAFAQRVHAQYYSVNYDTRTVAAMVAAFGTEVVAESYYREQADDILKHYTTAEVAAAGIFASKFLEHKALSDLGIWCSSTENYYYRRIYRMVAEKIMPKIWMVAKLMLRSPQTAIHWGSYLMKVCDDTKSLCMQFESIVTNSTLTFSDIVFLEINREIAPLLRLSELGGVDWQRMLDDMARVPGNLSREKLQSDIDNLYNMGVGLATAGIAGLGDALLPQSMFHELLNGKVSEIAALYDHYADIYEQAERGIGNMLLDRIGGEENVAGLFEAGAYRPGRLDERLYGRRDGKLLHAAVVYRKARTRKHCAVRLLSPDGRQQHPVRRRVDALRDDRSRILPQCLAAGTGARQLGAACRLVAEPRTAAQQPQRRLHIHHRLLDERLHHQPERKADQEGIRL